MLLPVVNAHLLTPWWISVSWRQAVLSWSVMDLQCFDVVYIYELSDTGDAAQIWVHILWDGFLYLLFFSCRCRLISDECYDLLHLQHLVSQDLQDLNPPAWLWVIRLDYKVNSEPGLLMPTLVKCLEFVRQRLLIVELIFRETDDLSGWTYCRSSCRPPAAVVPQDRCSNKILECSHTGAHSHAPLCYTGPCLQITVSKHMLHTSTRMYVVQ